MTQLDLLSPNVKQTYGCHCSACGSLWDCYQVPIDMRDAIKAMDANRKCHVCESAKILIVMPEVYQRLVAEAKERFGE